MSIDQIPGHRDQHTRTGQDRGMRIEWNVPVPMSDGTILRADVFRPATDEPCPVVFSHGVYAKGLPFQSDVYRMQWDKLLRKDPTVQDGSSNAYQAWEVTDPERWVPHGYTVVRVDSRGAGWSPGYLDPFSAQEVRDACEALEWAARQPWSTGRVGMLGISYYAVMGWHVAAQQPEHLTALIAWEGFSDHYRDACYHGGIASEFVSRWLPSQLVPVQHGQGERSPVNPHTGQPVAGPETLEEAELLRNRVDYWTEIRGHNLADEWHADRSPDVSRIKVPILSAANWGGQGIHPRGNYNAFVLAASEQKWLEVHGDTHWTHFYSGYGVDLQRRFFDHFLKGEDNGWNEEPPVQLNIRFPGETFTLRGESSWPLEGTRWTAAYFDGEGGLSLDGVPPAGSLQYDVAGDGLMFHLGPRDEELEITGPLSAKLFISSSTTDADLFVVVQLFAPDGSEVTFEGSTDPNTPIANGWLRASHRELDKDRSQPWQPVHPHKTVAPLEPGEIYEVDVEIWPTSIVIPPGYRLAVSIRGKDYRFQGDLDDFADTFIYSTRGTGGMTHEEPNDRPAERKTGFVTVHLGEPFPSHVLIPVIPATGRPPSATPAFVVDRGPAVTTSKGSA